MAALRKRSARRKIAERLRRFRIANDLTQEVAAKRLRITRSQWCEIEAGRQSIPAERIVDFADLVQRPVADLLGIDEQIKVAA